MEEYFTSDTLFTETLSNGTKVSVRLPQAISDFLNPDVWLYNNNTAVCKNIIPLCIAVTCGFEQYPNSSPHNPLFDMWTKEYSGYTDLGRVFIDVYNLVYARYAFIIFTQSTISQSSSTVTIGKTVILRIPTTYGGFSIGTSFNLQGGYSRTLGYSGSFDQVSDLHNDFIGG
jgi:hypothetical protein